MHEINEIETNMMKTLLTNLNQSVFKCRDPQFKVALCLVHVISTRFPTRNRMGAFFIRERGACSCHHDNHNQGFPTKVKLWL